MITIDFECVNQHKFEGFFRDYGAYREQHDKGLIQCPLCGTNEVKRIFSGCSIQPKKSSDKTLKKEDSGFLEKLNEISRFVQDNFENVGEKFAERARAMHYGIEEEKSIYGKTSPVEAKELIDEGIGVMPIIDTEKIIN
ncbi:MAG TPA: DUF1178 family protein [Spirochaetota bacterium]|nr:DUF1178 family protein [Spirochaetota bacterium]HPJ36497.1 DUF1178 family protein [Spirochaetota bacterium]